jgi:hypothetical protein
VADLLEQSDIIFECKENNPDLLAFLSQSDAVEQLVRFVIARPPDDESDDPDLRHKAYLASEVFACEPAQVLDTLCDDRELLGLLFSILDQPPPLEAACAAYFCKTVGALFNKKHANLTEFFQETDQLEEFLTHLQLYFIAELLIHIAWGFQEFLDTGGVDFGE